MKVAYVINKNTYDTKMSRVRFHGMEAIDKLVALQYTGIGWPDYDENKSIQRNIGHLYQGEDLPDLIVAFKPLELKGVRDLTVPLCLRYNEMWDKSWTTKEITESGAKMIVCHHLNDMPYYQNAFPNLFFTNISHCAEASIYKDYGETKTLDVLLVGSLWQEHYPFRARLHRLLGRLNKHLKCVVLEHPGGELRPNIAVLEKYARLINQSKITLTCSSKHKYRLGKYSEIPLCNSLLGADLPDEDQDWFQQWMLVLDPNDSDDVICDKLMYYVTHDEEREEKIKLGSILNKEYTQEEYAQRFVWAAEEFLENTCKS